MGMKLAGGIWPLFVVAATVIISYFLTSYFYTITPTFGTPFMLVGGVFAVIGSLGLVRFPDVYSRSHGQTLTAVGGVCLVLLGSMIDWFSPVSFKILFLIILIFVTSPVATHAITRAAYLSGTKAKGKDEWKGKK